MVEELGSVLVFAGRPQPNHAEDKFIFLQYRTIGSRTNDSWGLYVQEVVGGKRRMLDEFVTHTWREGWVYKQIRTLGWSPDDRFFAFARNEFRDLVICDVNQGRPVAVFPTKTKFLSGAWLTSEKLVCTDGQQMFEFVQSGDQWLGPKSFASTEGGLKGIPLGSKEIESVQAITSDAVLWKLGDTIMKSSVNPEEPPVQVWQSPPDELVDFVCARETGKLLLHARDKQGDFFVNLELPAASGRYVAASMERNSATNFRISQVRLINQGRGHAFLGESDFTLNSVGFKLEMAGAGPGAQIPMAGEIKNYEAGRQHLFIFGSLTNEPAGVWEYDLRTGRLEPLASNQPRPFQFASSQSPLKSVITNAAGKALTCYLLPPTKPVAGRLPPLVLGVMGYTEKTYYWDRYAQTIANCGACFVTVDRRGRAENEWADDLLTVYDSLNRNHGFDPRHVYLLGISKGAITMNHLLETRPEQWRGAIFLSPGALPDPSRLAAKKIFLDIGGLDPTWGNDGVRAKAFHDAAAKAGADVTFYIRPGVEHNCRILSVEKERLHQLAAFLDASH